MNGNMDGTPKVLMVVTQEILTIRNDGGKKVSYRNYELLKDVFGDENVSLCMLTNKMPEEQDKDFEENPVCGPNIYRITAYAGIIDRALNILTGRLFTNRRGINRIVDYVVKNHIDMVYIDRSIMGPLTKILRAKAPQCKIWVFVHNIEKEYFKNKLKNKPLISGIICRSVAKSERKTLSDANLVITLTERDAVRIKDVFGVGADYVLPSSFKDIYKENMTCVEDVNHNSDVTELLFVGSNFGPNYDGIKWFVDKVMSDRNDCHLTIVGKDFEKNREDLERENVTVVGTVEDPGEYYVRDNIMVMPIFYGDGQKVKTAEAMMYGKIIIATSEALEGYDCEAAQGIIRADDEAGFNKAVDDIKAIPDKQRLRTSVRNLFTSKYSYEATVNLYKDKLYGELAKSINYPSVAMIEYQGRVDINNKAVGHSPKVLVQYRDMIADFCNVKIFAPKEIIHEIPEYMRTGMHILPKNIVMKSGNTVFERINNKFHMFKNIKNAIKNADADYLWFYNVEFYFFLYLWLFVKTKKKIVITMYIDGYHGGLVSGIKMKIFRKAVKKVESLIFTGIGFATDAHESVFIPDYFYEKDRFEKYVYSEKKEEAVCLGTMSEGKELEEMVEAFAKNGYPLKIVGRFFDEKRYNELCRKAADNISVTNAYVSEEEYLSMLGEARYCVLPYSKNKYNTQTSGVLQESVFLNTVPVSYEEVLSGNGIPGIGFSSWDELSLDISDDGYSELLANYEKLRNKTFDYDINKMKYRNIFCQ